MSELECKRQPLEQAVCDYRKKHPGPLPDFDVKFVLDILSHSNESSNIRVAINPIVNGLWDKHAAFFGVKGCYISEDHRLVLTVHRDKATLNADQLIEKVNKAMKSCPHKHIPIAFEYKEEIHKLTDMYGHSLVNDMWAGLPFDIILAEVTADANKTPEEETEK